MHLYMTPHAPYLPRGRALHPWEAASLLRLARSSAKHDNHALGFCGWQDWC